MNPQCPQSYAKHLAGYIADPSTIRVRVLEYFDRAPSVDDCAMFRRKAVNRSKREEARYEAKDRPFPCGHERSPDNTFWVRDHIERCKTCRRQMESDAARRLEERQAKREQARREEEERQAKRQAEMMLAKTKSLHEPSSADVIISVCEAYDLTPSELRAPARHKRLVCARSIVTKILRDRGLSFPQIKRLLDRDCHTTIIHLYKTFDSRCAKHPEVLAVYRKLAA